MLNDMLTITVAFATSKTTEMITLTVSAGTTLQQAILQSGIVTRCSELAVLGEQSQPYQVGVYGELRDLSEMVCAGDRIEIYRPLHKDPMLARKDRVQTVKKKKFKPLRAKDLA